MPSKRKSSVLALWPENGCIWTEISIWKDIVKKHPKLTLLHDFLSDGCNRDGNSDLTIEAWTELVDTHPYLTPLQGKLTQACEAKQD